MLDFVALTISAFSRIACSVIVPGFGSARIRYESDRIGVIGLLGVCCWTLAQRVELFRLIIEYDVDQVLGLLEIARANKINFGIVEESHWFLFNFEDSLLYYSKAFENPKRSADTNPEVQCVVETSGVIMAWMLPFLERN